MDSERERLSMGAALVGLIQAHATVEWIYLRCAIGIAAGLTPFVAFAKGGTTGVLVGVAWLVVYLATTLLGTTVFFMFAVDGIRVATGRPAKFMPVFEEAAKHEAILREKRDRSPWLAKAWIWASAGPGFYVNPLSLPALSLAGYLRDKSGAKLDGQPVTYAWPVPEPAHPPITQVEVYVEVQRRERRIEAVELNDLASANA